LVARDEATTGQTQYKEGHEGVWTSNYIKPQPLDGQPLLPNHEGRLMKGMVHHVTNRQTQSGRRMGYQLNTHRCAKTIREVGSKDPKRSGPLPQSPQEEGVGACFRLGQDSICHKHQAACELSPFQLDAGLKDQEGRDELGLDLQ
jgi:hypothetical protein